MSVATPAVINPGGPESAPAQTTTARPAAPTTEQLNRASTQYTAMVAERQKAQDQGDVLKATQLTIDALKIKGEWLQGKAAQFYEGKVLPGDGDTLSLVIGAEDLKAKNKIHSGEYTAIATQNPIQHEYIQQRLADGATVDELKAEIDTLRTEERTLAAFRKNKKGEVLTPPEYDLTLRSHENELELYRRQRERNDYHSTLRDVSGIDIEQQQAASQLDAIRAQMDQAQLAKARADLQQVVVTGTDKVTKGMAIRLDKIAQTVQATPNMTREQFDQVVATTAQEGLARIEANMNKMAARATAIAELRKRLAEPGRISDHDIRSIIRKVQQGTTTPDVITGLQTIEQLATPVVKEKDMSAWRELYNLMDQEYLKSAQERPPLPDAIPYQTNAEGLAEIPENTTVIESATDLGHGISSDARLVKLKGIDVPVVQLKAKSGTGTVEQQIKILTTLKNSGVSHVPQIIGIKPAAETRGAAYFYEEFVEGESYAELVNRVGDLSIQEATGNPEVAQASYELLEGIAEMHDRGITHKDINPTHAEHAVWRYIKQPDGTIKKGLTIIDYGNANISGETQPDVNGSFDLILKYGFSLPSLPHRQGAAVDAWFQQIQGQVKHPELIAVCKKFVDGEKDARNGYQNGRELFNDMAPLLRKWF